MDSVLILKTYEVVDEIKQSKTYQRLIELNQIINSNQEIILLLQSFDSIKEKYQETSKYGKYHPDLKKVQLELASKKEEVYSHPIIIEFKQLEKDLQKTLDHISSEIAQAVSPKIKHPNEIGLIQKH